MDEARKRVSRKTSLGGPRHQPLYHARSWREMKDSNPRNWIWRASVLAAGRISRKFMAELTGIEPVPADRQSAILPIDHSSGSLPWTRTTISAFRVQRPAIGRRGNFKLSKNWPSGNDSNAGTRIQVQALPLDDPASRFQSDCFHGPYAQHRRLIGIMAKPSEIRTCASHHLTVISSAIVVELRCKLYLKPSRSITCVLITLVAARRTKLPSQP
jgi:hypothetical protein